MSETHSGRCLCGGVSYEVDGPLDQIVACHCEQCRRTSGHHVAATRCPAGALRMIRGETLAWYRSSAEAERGFCTRCGANLFWRRLDGPNISIMAGTLDSTEGLPFNRHIFVANKADYVTIPDDAEQFPHGD